MAEKWNTPADESMINQTILELRKNGIEAEAFSSREEARKRIIELIPSGALVMDMTSVTLDESGISEDINKSGKWDSARIKLEQMSRENNEKEMRAFGAAPDYAIGSAHAVTMEGEILIASYTGSQLPAYAYSGGKVIFVIGTQKITKNLDEGLKRIYEHSLPLESERAKKAYGVEGSSVNKILIINKEVQPGRIRVIFIKENIGF